MEGYFEELTIFALLLEIEGMATQANVRQNKKENDLWRQNLWFFGQLGLYFALLRGSFWFMTARLEGGPEGGGGAGGTTTTTTA